MVKQKDHPMTPMTVSIAETIRATSLSQATIYRMIGRGEIETVKVSGRRLVKMASLRQLIGDATAAEAQ